MCSVGGSLAGFPAGQEATGVRKERNSLILVTGAGAQDSWTLTLAIFKHSTILGKNIQITMTSAQVHNSLRHVYTESLYKVLLAFFTEMGTVDSAQGL